jgi:hypothetical protein
MTSSEVDPLRGYARQVLREEEALVVEIKPFNLHGMNYQDVTITYRDRSVDQARLGPEGVPENLRSGDVVLVTKVANMVVSLRRSSERNEEGGPS